MTLPGVLAPLVDDPGSAAVVADFDGTLAPIVDDPTRARPLPAAVSALRALVEPFGLVGVVSGRSVDFLRAQLPVDGLTLVGQYGLERLVDGEVVVDERAEAYAGAVAVAGDEAEHRWPRLLVERKGALAFSVHWRATPDAAPPLDELEAFARRYGLAVSRGRMVGEVRAPVDVDKGAALSLLIQERRVRACAFAGDDYGDLSAFSALTDRAERQAGFVGVRIAVRSPEAPPALLATADHVADSPADLAALFESLAEAVNAPR
jgi:trehalose 6-phosphate phosphatase